MKLIKISERFYVFPYVKPTDRPNLYYFLGDDYSVVVDAGNSSKHVEEFYNELTANNLPFPEYTIISHWHWDHTFGLCNIVGKSISSSYTHNKLIEVSKWKWNLDDMKKREMTGEDIAFCNECIKLEYDNLGDIKVCTSDIILDERKIFDLGGYSIEVIPEVSTHTEGALYVYCPSEKALIVGDGDCEDFYHNNIYDQDKLKEMINFFESVDYDDHYLGHAQKETKQFALSRLRECIE